MKTKAIVALTTALGMLALATAAHAEIVDKGALGKYERRGQFLVPINTPPRPVAAASSETAVEKPAPALEQRGAKVTPVHTHKGPHHPGGSHGTPRYQQGGTQPNTQKAAKGGS